MLTRRNRTSSLDIDHALYLYFLGLSTRGVSKAMFFLNKVKRSHVAVWKCIHKYPPKKIISKSKKISEFKVDETLVKVVQSSYGSGLQLSQKTVKFSHFFS